MCCLCYFVLLSINTNTPQVPYIGISRIHISNSGSGDLSYIYRKKTSKCKKQSSLADEKQYQYQFLGVLFIPIFITVVVYVDFCLEKEKLALC
jgi:hypothetical protein